MLINELGRFVADVRYDGLSTEVINAAKLRVLDLLAASLAGFQLGAHKLLLPLFNGAPEATVWALERKLPLRDAVLINSFVSHSQYLEDGSRYTGGHPSSVVIPAALTLGEVEHATGKQMIAAVIAGYEIFLRLGRAIYPSTVNRGFQSTAVLGAVSAAAAAANTLKLDARSTTHALAIACNLGGGLKEALKSSATQPIQVGRSAEGGVLAAQMAQAGAQGAEGILENGFLRAYADNPATAQIREGLGTEFRIFETYFKVHGGCRGNHAPIDVVQDIVAAHSIKPQDISKIRVAVDAVTYAAEIPKPVNGNEAQFSIAFSIAAALVEGNASIFQFTDEKVADPRIGAMMARIDVGIDEKLNEGYPDKRSANAEITLVSGARYTGAIDNAKGEPECPLDVANVLAKFMTLTAATLGGNAARVRNMVLALEDLSDVSLLTDCLRRPPR